MLTPRSQATSTTRSQATPLAARSQAARTPPTAMQLAAAGFSVEHGAALLKLRNRCSLETAYAAMRQAHGMLSLPVAERLQAGLLEVACHETGAALRTVADGGECQTTRHTPEAHPNAARQDLRRHPHLSAADIAHIADTNCRIQYVSEYPEPRGD